MKAKDLPLWVSRATSVGNASMSDRSPEADIELSCTKVAEKHQARCF